MLYFHVRVQVQQLQQPQQPQQQPPSSQPSAQQLRILVQQIQMAVQAGHLNPQILNQPLAPQTLISLNQLLQQIKTLQQLRIFKSGIWRILTKWAEMAT